MQNSVKSCPFEPRFLLLTDCMRILGRTKRIDALINSTFVLQLLYLLSFLFTIVIVFEIYPARFITPYFTFFPRLNMAW